MQILGTLPPEIGASRAGLRSSPSDCDDLKVLSQNASDPGKPYVFRTCQASWERGTQGLCRRDRRGSMSGSPSRRNRERQVKHVGTATYAYPPYPTRVRRLSPLFSEPQTQRAGAEQRGAGSALHAGSSTLSELEGEPSHSPFPRPPSPATHGIKSKRHPSTQMRGTDLPRLHLALRATPLPG